MSPAPGVAPDRPHPLRPAAWGDEVTWRLAAGGSQLLLRTLFRLRLSDVPPLPAGPLILAPNHRSYLDPIVVGSSVDRRPIFMMQAKYYDQPLLRRFYRATRCIAVEGQGDDRRALRQARDVLAAGRVLVIFPEGTISPDGSLQRAQPGMGWLARSTGTPVCPVWVGGTREALRKGSLRLRLHPIVMRVGEPIDPHAFPPGRAGEEALTAKVMAAIEALAPPPRGAAREAAHRDDVLAPAVAPAAAPGPAPLSTAS